MGLQPLEELLAERDVLVRKVADLRARHGAFGTYNDLRKIKLSAIAQLIRAKALRDRIKVTGPMVEDAAHADPRYVEFVTTATMERAQWAILENHIQGIDETIMRGQAIARFVSNETRLGG
jgi:hypothetical protein